MRFRAALRLYCYPFHILFTEPELRDWRRQYCLLPAQIWAYHLSRILSLSNIPFTWLKEWWDWLYQLSTSSWRPFRAQQSSIPCVNNWQRGEGGLEERGDFNLTANECKCWEYNISNVTVDPDSEHLKAQRILAQAFTSFKVMWKTGFLKGILIRLINITSFGR